MLRLTPQAAIGGAILVLFLVLQCFPRPGIRYQAATGAAVPRIQRIADRDVYWELPAAAPTAVLLFAHGCAHAGSDMWPAHPETCPHCLGLPEEQRIREMALQRGYAVVAVSSGHATSKGKGCWSARDEGSSDDLHAVAEAVQTLIHQEPMLRDLPIYALGASSGGGFVLMLPQTMQLAGICAQIMGVPPEALQPQLQQHPPTVFMHMPRDARMAAAVQQDIAVLQGSGVPVEEVQVAPRAVTPQFLQLHSSGAIPRDMAVGIVDALRSGGLIDASGLLVEDPRRTEWKAAVGAVTHANLEPDSSSLAELLKVAWAGHEIVSSGVASALTWLQSGGGKGALLQSMVDAEAQEEAQAEAAL